MMYSNVIVSLLLTQRCWQEAKYACCTQPFALFADMLVSQFPQ